GGSYRLLATRPSIIIAAVSPTKAVIRSITRDSGRTRWEVNVDRFVSLAASEDRATAYVLSSQANGSSLEARSMGTGDIKWTRTLATRDTVASLTADATRVLLAGN